MADRWWRPLHAAIMSKFMRDRVRQKPWKSSITIEVNENTPQELNKRRSMKADFKLVHLKQGHSDMMDVKSSVEALRL